VLVANGEAGGKTCGPIVRRILEQTLAAEAGGVMPVPIRGEPMKRHFDQVVAVPE
jgi:hypothetical protein